MQEYRAKNGKYRADLSLLEKHFPGVSFKDNQDLELLGTDYQFHLQKNNAKLKLAVSVDHDSKFATKILL